MTAVQALAGGLLGLALLSAPSVVSSTEPTSPPVPSIWAEFDERDLQGRRWNDETLADKVVLIDFWATWCAPCLAAFPTFRDATERYGERGFLVLGVSLNRSDRRAVTSFLRRQALDWPQLHDGRGFAGPIARRFQVEQLPRTLLVDRSGRVVGVDLEPAAILAAIPGLLPREAN